MVRSVGRFTTGARCAIRRRQLLKDVPMPPRKKKDTVRPDDAAAISPAPYEPLPTPEPSVTTAPTADHVPDSAEPAPVRSWQPDPFVLMAVTLGPDAESPRIRLYRSNKLNQMAIKFDTKPEHPYRERLRANGWRWREDEGVWTKQLERERRAAGQLQAERLFTEIGDAIRAELGLEPRRGVGS